MQNPTTSICNGSRATASVVKTKGSSISVTTDEIADGVTYYCRAYVVAGGVTYYSGQTSFGIGAKSYGTFNVSGSGNQFTITRTGGTDGAQTVYYRTKNGSAVAGTHYTENAGSVTFAQGDTSKTVTVTEQGANAAYNGNIATAYSNADREYFFEIYRVDGGGTLGTDTEAKRTLETNKIIDRNIYNSVKETTGIVTSSDPKSIKDRTKAQGAGDTNATVNFMDVNRDNKENWHRNIGVEEIYGSDAKAYLAAKQDTNWLYRFTLSGKEEKQGYEDVWFGSSQPPREDIELGGAKTLPSLDGQIWAGIFEIKGSGEMKETTMAVLGNSGSLIPSSSDWADSEKRSQLAFDNNNYYGILDINSSAWVCFSAHGEDEDQWYITAYDEYSVVQDKKEPDFLAVGPMESISKYKAGDTFYISLIFNEIVDGENSDLRNVSVNTSWGDASYAGGADTNVLYFKGKVSDTASGVLQLKKINNQRDIQDMCSFVGDRYSFLYANPAGGSVDNTTPTVTVGSITNTNGTLTAAVSATKYNTLKYTWTQSSAMPATGWLDIASGSTATTRQTSGTWYLHAMATNTENGKTAHTYQFITLPSSGTGAVSLPELTVSANNSSWAANRKITLTKSPSDATVTYTGPGVTTAQTVSGTSVTVTQNGIYTFKLTSGGDTVVKQVAVSKIDASAPTAVITEPGSGYLTQSQNVTFTIKPSDTGGSGVKSVTGKWYKNGSSTGTDASLTNNGDGTYTAKTSQAAGTNGTWKLTVTVTDNAGNTETAASQTYTVKLKEPTVTVTKGAADTNGAVNYTYSVSTNGQTIQSIQLPDGSITTSTNGSFKLTEAGTYYVTVTDTAGHVVQSDAMTVTGSVDGEPPEIRLNPNTTDWVNADTGVTVTVSVYDNIAPTAASWKMQDEAGTKTVSLSQDTDAGVGSQAKTGSFKATANGTYTVTARDAKDNVATETIEITNIDGTAPTVTAAVDSSDWSTSHSITITAEDAGDDASGIKSVRYAVVSTPDGTAAETDLTTLADADNGTVEVDTDGTHYLYCIVEDNAGNTSVCYSDAIRIDTQSPKVTVSGGTNGALRLELSASAEFGDSGRKSFTVKKGEDGTETELTGDSYPITYPVTDRGAYYFSATSNAGKTTTETVNVYSISFDSNAGIAVPAQYVADGGCFGTLPEAERAGYAFDGWYTAADGGTKITGETEVTADVTVYAHWADAERPDAPVLKEGESLPEGWLEATAGYKIPLTLRDNEGVAKLFVKIDNGTFTEVVDYKGTGKEESYEYPVRGGSHTYVFKASDAAENESGESEKFTVKVRVPEETPEASIDYEKETLKGLKPGEKYKIGITADNGTASKYEEFTADKNGEIPLGAPADSEWFGKKISVVKAGDGEGTADSGPQVIAIPAKDGAAPGTDGLVTEYVSEEGISDGKITGITPDNDKKLEYSTDGGKTWTPVTGTEIAGLPQGDCELRYAGDNGTDGGDGSGEGGGTPKFPSESVTVTVGVKTKEDTPSDVKIDYEEKALTGLTPEQEYKVSTDGGSTWTPVTAGDDGSIPLPEDACGKEIEIKKPGNGMTTADSEPLIVTVPAKGAAPSGLEAEYVSASDVSDGKITGVTPDMEYSTDGGSTWTRITEDAITDNAITGLPEGTYQVRYAADNGADSGKGRFESESITINIGVKGPEATPKASIDYEKETLKGLKPGEKYKIGVTADDGTVSEYEEFTADENGEIPLSSPADSKWFGKTLSVVKKGDGKNTTDSEAQDIAIPAKDGAAPGTDDFVTEYVSEPGASDGKITGTDTGANPDKKLEYSDDGGKTWTPVPEGGASGLPEGSYELRYAGDNDTDGGDGSGEGGGTPKFPSESVTVKIGVKEKEDTPSDVKIDYEEKSLTGLEPGKDYKVSTDDGSTWINVTADDDGSIPLPENAYDKKIEIQKPGNGTTTADSEPLAVTVPAKGAAPSGLEAEFVSADGASDGRITGVTPDMEYSTDGGSTWNPITEDAITDNAITDLPKGSYQVRYAADNDADNGNGRFESESVTINIGVKGKEPAPSRVSIDYEKETLKGLEPGEKYKIGITADGGTVPEYKEFTADENGEIPLGAPADSKWFGKTLTVVKKGDGKNTTDSDGKTVTVPARPQKPVPSVTGETAPGASDGKLTGLAANKKYQVSTDGGNTWTEKTANAAGELTNLAPGSYVVRESATGSGFTGEASAVITVEEKKAVITFMADGAQSTVREVAYGGTLTDVPAIPSKKDAGGQLYAGKWCMDEQGITPAVFTDITAHMTVYAVYTKAYTVTLQSGTGYTLSAVNGSVSPVMEGGSFTFRFALADGYEKTGSFTIKIGGAAVALNADGSYTIADITENKTVTVEGIRKTETPESSGGSNTGANNEPNGDDAPSNNTSKDNGNTLPTYNPLPSLDTLLLPTVPQPSNTTNPPTAQPPVETPGDEPEITPSASDSSRQEDNTKQENTETSKPEQELAKQPSEAEKAPDENSVQTIPVFMDNGRIAISDGQIKTGNVKDMAGANTTLALGDGKIIVTIVCQEQTYTAGIADTVAVANAVLPQEQLELINHGETTEIRINVTDISGNVPTQDRNVIENGIEEYRKEVPGLVIGMYVDLSVFIKVGTGGWNAVTTTSEPIEVVIGIPEALQADGREYYIIRAHGGEYTFMEDRDDTPETITISSDQFSSYAIAYEQTDSADAENAGRCGLCHICPTFLGICFFIWLTIILVIILIIRIVICRKRGKQENEK